MNSVASRHRTLWRWLVLGAFAVLALAGLILSILQGVAAITPVDVIHILWQPSVRTADQIIWNIRLAPDLDGGPGRGESGFVRCHPPGGHAQSPGRPAYHLAFHPVPAWRALSSSSSGRHTSSG